MVTAQQRWKQPFANDYVLPFCWLGTNLERVVSGMHASPDCILILVIAWVPNEKIYKNIFQV